MAKIYLMLSIEALKGNVEAVKTAHKKHQALLAAMDAGIDEDTCQRIQDELDDASKSLARVILSGLTDYDVDNLEQSFFKAGTNE